MRRRAVLLVVTGLGAAQIWGAAPIPRDRAAAAADSDVVGTLRPGQHVYWSGGRVAYALDVADGGGSLRVAVDIPDCCGASVEVLDPAGRVAATSDGYLSAEAYVDRPAAGQWTVRVPRSAAGTRLRAKLERAEATAGPRSPRPVLPNLRLVPPYEFSFSSGLGVVPTAPGCNPDDAAEYGGRRCLRFSLGPANTGPGPFQLRFAQLEGLVTSGQVYQRVYDSAGAFTERKAGMFEYHKTHQHYHHSGFGSLELLSVDTTRRTMTKVGEGPKQGFCTADVVLFDWHRFDQDRQDSTESRCVSEMTPTGTFGPTGTVMGVSPGWADIYLWYQDGNYVDFAANRDGRYVVRSTADALGHVLESNENDNTSYAYVQIDGTRITVLERGFGQGPFDARKRLATDRVRLTAG
ncbi:MAG TPA: lysyl oxidase family protein [Mycobacteriales bacterium]|nr:lysyl oxidase family protein [Mycobacteriales bacterium]